MEHEAEETELLRISSAEANKKLRLKKQRSANEKYKLHQISLVSRVIRPYDERQRFDSRKRHGRESSFRHRVQTRTGFHSASYPVRNGGWEADHSRTTSAEVKNVWSYTATLPYIFMV
jgi:hypothetical protein